MITNAVRLLEKLSAYLCMGLILCIRPLLGPASCRYEKGCTAYALTQLTTQPFHSALWRIIKRVLSCNPFYRS